MILAAVVALAGGGGAGLRYLADGAVKARRPGDFPNGTLLVNVTGSFVLGLVTGLVWYAGVSPTVRTVVGTGCCGGFTTWSTATFETVELWERGERRLCVTSTGLGLVAALAAAAAGVALAGL